MADAVKLFKTWSSPFSLRIVWALKLKGMSYESIDEDLTNKSPLLLQLKPVHKKIPVLVHNEKPIAESLAILEYMEETWKQNPLLPEDPYKRATARFWPKFGDDDDELMPSGWEFFLKQGKEQEEAYVLTTQNLNFLEEELKGKKFFGGEAIGLADIALGWLANLVPISEELLGLKLITEQQFPSLFAWMQRFANVAILKETWPPHDKYADKFRAHLAGRS